MLERIAQNISKCLQCELGLSRLNVVPGEGTAKANIILIGEAPGEKEDKTGRPFVGSAGKLLDEILASVGIDRKEIFITSLLKCRPPQNRNPRAKEIKACVSWLNQQINFIQPKVICTMGRFATKVLTGLDRPLSEIHGKFIEKNDIFYYPIYHPAAIFYNSKLKEELKNDLKKLKNFLGSLGQ